MYEINSIFLFFNFFLRYSFRVCIDIHSSLCIVKLGDLIVACHHFKMSTYLGMLLSAQLTVKLLVLHLNHRFNFLRHLVEGV